MPAELLTVEAQAVELVGLERLPIDDWIVATEVGICADVQVIICEMIEKNGNKMK